MNKINQIFSGDAKRKRSSYFEKEKRNVDYCEICRKSFKQLIVRKHKCKRCKRYICSQCGQNKTLVISKEIIKFNYGRKFNIDYWD